MMKQRKSEVRKKRKTITVRVTPVEKLEIQRMADAAGVTVGSYIRKNILERVITKSQKAPTWNKKCLSKLSGQIGKVGSDIKGKLNEDGTLAAEHTEWFIKTCCDTFATLQDEILKAIEVS